MDIRNLLGTEKSPYLLQHKDNPIAWHPWGEDAFARARAENKPIFLSIGYSTCHWCHVMAHESFGDQEVAEALNKSFVSIKVDREERPDVDDVYMKALQTLTGGGGWPMSVWLTPEGKPFFAGTYFPKFRFLQLLRRIDQLWRDENRPLHEDGERLAKAVLESARQETSDGDAAGWEEALGSFISGFQHHFDQKNGGFGGAPKFPQSMNLMLMMRQDRLSGLNQAEEMVTATLNKMVRGGVYDQLQGGFHRYSVDEMWLVPHFEKMIYDQALITMSLLEAAQLYGPQPELERAARETLDYVLREMTHAQGGFYAAQDADSLNPIMGHNQEGFFATYEYDELKRALTPSELKVLGEHYGVMPQGNFEGRSILHLQDGSEGSVGESVEVKSAFAKLRQLRAARPQPHLDDKVIGAWNGWMIAALAQGARVLGEARYGEAAARALAFAKQNLWKAGKLARYWRDGETRGQGMAEDYASLIFACLETHQINFDPSLAAWALELQSVLDRDFWDGEDGDYFANDGGDALLPMRPKDDYDGVTPSANSMAAYNLQRLYLLTGEPRFRARAERIFARLFPKFNRYPSGLAFLGMAMSFQLAGAKVAVMTEGEWVRDFHADRARKFDPFVYWTRAEAGWPVAAGKGGERARIYVCEDGRCLNPSETASAAESALNI